MTNEELENYINTQFNVDEEDVYDKYTDVIKHCIYFNNDEFAILLKSRHEEAYMDIYTKDELISKVLEIIDEIEDEDLQSKRVESFKLINV